MSKPKLLTVFDDTAGSSAYSKFNNPVSVTLSDRTLIVNETTDIHDNTIITFKPGCDSSDVDSIIINSETYTIKDSLGNVVTGDSGTWNSGALISLALDTTNKVAYILTSNCKASKVKIIPATLRASDWNPDTQTVSVDGVLPVGSSQLLEVWPNPKDTNVNAYESSGIEILSRAENSITFASNSEIPTIDIDINISIETVEYKSFRLLFTQIDESFSSINLSNGGSIVEGSILYVEPGTVLHCSVKSENKTYAKPFIYLNDNRVSTTSYNYEIKSNSTVRSLTRVATRRVHNSDGSYTNMKYHYGLIYIDEFDDLIKNKTSGRVISVNGQTGNVIVKPNKISVNLSSDSWDSSTRSQTVTVTGISENEDDQLITPTPAKTSQTAYYDAGIKCTDQSLDSLTFTADTIPTEDLTVYVIIQDL